MKLDSSFEDDLREAVLDEAEHELIGKQGNLVHEAVQFTHDRLREYGREFDYRVDSIIDSFGGVEVDRSANRLTIRWGWTHEAMVYLEFGTSDHTIEGDPVLSFVWEERHNPPEWVREEFDQEGNGYRVFLPEVEVAGVKETRAARDALNWLRREVQS
ncbi:MULTISPECIES: hypothetical protein [Halorussus]|uniref:hypothetical protein n=1 Tax=Halorussus TaxID=1070314 RepID=UPI0020A007C2|nr:hypothetical protein [Halorussus vallis]USZ75663.1 hypothetical protein NGM07_19820 [Halorussus vallis]USZ75718.1 hypothetical protein NGM07_20100 [Halorussus vallis]USZ75736.1 hypothetical protein NGM07_00045 [Halorussus vallis]